ncbi:Rqc2 family fibronectin-binding protein [Eubacterium xylanophilum]|uniref:Rqc2 family fibronectin-binding protein n=1 Tax=Eubacterium xylanophilum TaxID=39497 RepID=UPI00047D4173|nr:NFACT RNA binding domain-containing protein [Eubacterium xylanophilum]
MAFDGFTISSIVNELNNSLTGGRIQKIAQPEPDEIRINIKNNRKTYKLVLSANASLPLIYLTETNKTSPLTAPNFCMLLRKRIGSAEILGISQVGLERVIRFELESYNELGDLVRTTLIIEIMGKHSNIIFVDSDNLIIDSIKHVNALMSSVREVLPGREYFTPNTKSKLNPYDITPEIWMGTVINQPSSVAKGLCNKLAGFSMSFAHEVTYRAGIDGDMSMSSLNGNQIANLRDVVRKVMEKCSDGQFAPEIIYNSNNEPVEFAAFHLEKYDSYKSVKYESASKMIETFYGEKERIQRIRQKSIDLRKSIQILVERNVKKRDILTKQFNDTQKRDKYKVYGELIQTYGYSLTPEDKVLTCTNYYDNKEINIPIDNTLSPIDNANKYFNRYNKLKRTYDAVSVQLEETNEILEHLYSIQNSIDFARSESDLAQIKEEIWDSGYIKRKHVGKKDRNKAKSNPYHYRSSDGYDMYVGKNNYQNEHLTFKVATGNDWWFHAKGAPGSHVIVICNNTEPPIKTFEEAAALAAHYSKSSNADKVEIDYTQKKHVKKPSGSKPGFVIYHTNYSLVAKSDITGIEEVKDD